MFEIALPIHFFSFCASFILVLIADHEGLSYIRGKKQLLNTKKLHILHNAIFIGLGLLIVSGLFLFTELKEVLITNPAFYAKMTMVAALVVNAFVIGRLMKIATLKPFASLTSEERRQLFISACISSVCWIGSAIIGFLYLE